MLDVSALILVDAFAADSLLKGYVSLGKRPFAGYQKMPGCWV
jgi:hypothetical protein